MVKHLLAAAAVAALFSGSAMAQVSSETSTTIRSTQIPVVDSYSSTKTQTTTDGDGVTTEKSHSVSRDGAGVDSKTSVQVNGPDGSKSMSRERRVSPDGSMTTRSKTTVKTDE